jgi:hypothetical protein
MSTSTETTVDGGGERSRTRRQRAPWRRRRWRFAVVVLAVLLAPVLYSYVSTVTKPSSLPLGIRSIEWLRANHGAWLVNNVESVYYRWTAPSKGGSTLTAIPHVGVRAHVVRRTIVRSFAPRRLTALIHPALPGEGAWQRAGPAVHGGPPVLLTTFRPEPSYPRIVAYVAWIDHTRTQLALYPGRYEPPAGAPRGPMSVPSGQRWRLLATFNSGFTYKDGHGGFFVNGRSYTPLRPGQGTLVEYRNGDVNVVDWRGGAVPRSWIVVARQNLPLIVNGGRANPSLSDGPAWGATLGNAIRVWRSGVGIDRHGNLIYAAANYQTVGTLAAILVHAGAVRAIELDINGEWPSFITYARGGARNASKLVPNGMQSAGRYLSPDDRDFFAVYRRLPHAAALVPFR